jgi:hypothetical protein
MIFRIVAILLIIFFICCKPKLVKSAKNVESLEVRMELKILWVLLEEYRSLKGHYPRALSELEELDSVSLTKNWDYKPDSSSLIVELPKKGDKNKTI